VIDDTRDLTSIHPATLSEEPLGPALRTPAAPRSPLSWTCEPRSDAGASRGGRPLTDRENPYLRGSITGGGTFLGGILHTLPFLIPQIQAALVVALAVIAFELVVLAWIRWWFLDTGFRRSFASVTFRGVVMVAISVGLGGAAG
jgi:VIT1/CCC1 family predicted Fe2+/Mn2+ transporter